MAYATISDVEARLTRKLTTAEKTACTALLEDAAVIIDAVASGASIDAKVVVSCRMVVRILGDGENAGIPIGATQGSMSGLGYSQSWMVSGGGSSGEMYLSKVDRQILGIGGKVGSYSPVQELAEDVT